ncbi:hypothetical protein BJV74DRAFT_193201 [Russula compacta]|nr:hypothetical protein BJV74DRAFT_193201 [Russula compacta]
MVHATTNHLPNRPTGLNFRPANIPPDSRSWFFFNPFFPSPNFNFPLLCPGETFFWLLDTYCTVPIPPRHMLEVAASLCELGFRGGHTGAACEFRRYVIGCARQLIGSVDCGPVCQADHAHHFYPQFLSYCVQRNPGWLFCMMGLAWNEA